MTKNDFLEFCNKNLNIIITEEKYNKLVKYYLLLVEWNKKFNLTAILEEKEVFLLHFYDSLCLSKYIDVHEDIKICDFGTGAGFPGMVIALIFDNVKVTLIESNQKKCEFLKYVKESLNINNVEIINSRIEDFSKNNREIFDIITCRAVTSIPIIIETSISSLKVGGVLSPLKTNCHEEIEKNKKLYEKLDLELIRIHEYKLPITEAYRSIPVFKKKKITSSIYPRNYSAIVKMYKNK